ncbi:helix-turn-helix domain-containing protein [Gordonia sp. CPCC 205333]|uniref:helix-turn-helix domain-containing protein n=1 Tax=Gordonia sp. CPCC 205333 TaxID=3140790 RepID=UPI003AF34922
MGLAAIRRAAKLTQTELARRMGVKQAAVSGLEGREDLLLSTLANYLAAAGATDIRISARLGERNVEVDLRAQPGTVERLGQHHP